MIGIVTFHRAHNYGAVLQCYALQEAIKQLKGCEVKVIDYSCESIVKGYTDGRPNYKHQSLKSALRATVLYVLKGWKKRIRFRKFNSFILSELNLSSNIPSVDSDELSKYSSIVFGSDQIWNTAITGNDLFYFGKMAFKGRKIGFAVSAGKKENEIGKYSTQIKDYYAIGVREKSLSESLHLIDVDSTVTVDPTLLLSSQQWERSLKLNQVALPTEEYVLVYPLRERAKTVKMAKELAARLGVRLVEIGAHVTILGHLYRKETVGPDEFVNLIRNAKAVVTNSFHGTVFSLIFNKDFYTVSLNDGEDGRVINLLQSVGLLNRLVSVGTEIIYKEIDYSDVNSRLESMRRISIEFLKTNLK